jgi:inosine-uridine nucleoside N-ribohydrolase
MARKVIIDCDPGIDDAVALCLALFDTRLEILGVTAVEGNVAAARASLNVQTVVDQLDPPRYPRLGAATPLEAAPAIDMRHLHGENGLGNAEFPVSQLHHQHPSEKILCDEVRSAPEQVTLLCLGPLSNLSRAFQRDPTLPQVIDQIIISGGSADCRGDVTPVAEFNMFYDPLAAQAVFRSPTTKILIPLEITQQVRLNLDSGRSIAGREHARRPLASAPRPLRVPRLPATARPREYLPAKRRHAGRCAASRVVRAAER